MEELINNATNDRKYITEKQIANAQKMTSAEYKMFFNALPEQNKDQLVKDWGKAPGNVFVYDDNLLVPGTLKGNIFVTVQPPRGFGEDPDKILHSPFCAPTHHYLGYYHWVRDIWKADAVVHDSLQRIKRFGVDETSIWNKYLTNGGRAIKPEFLIKLTRIAKKDSIVTITSLYVHLLDQFLWKLLGEEEIVVEANYLLARMAAELQVEAVQVTRVTVSEFNNAWEKLVISAI